MIRIAGAIAFEALEKACGDLVARCFGAVPKRKLEGGDHATTRSSRGFTVTSSIHGNLLVS